jgi:hypothetical protein
MVDVVRVKPPAQARTVVSEDPAGFALFNLKTSYRCRSAAGSAGRYFLDNHRSPDPQARIRLD